MGKTWLDLDDGQPIPIDGLGQYITPNPAERLRELAAERPAPPALKLAPASGVAADGEGIDLAPAAGRQVVRQWSDDNCSKRGILTSVAWSQSNVAAGKRVGAMQIIIFGAGVQGTLYGVRLARAGHNVTLVARGRQAEELCQYGAVTQDVFSSRTDALRLPVTEQLGPDTRADLCLVTVRREQLNTVLPALAAASALARIVFMVNHANGSEAVFGALGRARVVLAFPGAAGGIEAGGVDRYTFVSEQATAVEADALDVISVFRNAGLRVARVQDMDAWLRRHAVFVTAVAGALYESGGNVSSLAADRERMSTFILAVREGWSALDRRGVKAAPLALRTVFCWLPLPYAVAYWRRLLGSARGEVYFAQHVRRAQAEMAALASDVRELLDEVPAPHLIRLYVAIDLALLTAQAGGHSPN